MVFDSSGLSAAIKKVERSVDRELGDAYSSPSRNDGDAVKRSGGCKYLIFNRLAIDRCRRLP